MVSVCVYVCVCVCVCVCSNTFYLAVSEVCAPLHFVKIIFRIPNDATPMTIHEFM